MTRLLQCFNFAGIVLLFGLCSVQWYADSQLHRQVIVLEQFREQQRLTITEQEKAIRERLADVEDFRARLARADSAAKDAQAKVESGITERTQLRVERDQLESAYDNVRTALDKWTAAVAARDESLKKASVLAQQLANDRNEAVAKYNTLVAQYNAAAAQVRKAADTIQLLIDQRNDAVTRFNDLAVRYNALITHGSTPSTNP